MARSHMRGRLDPRNFFFFSVFFTPRFFLLKFLKLGLKEHLRHKLDNWIRFPAEYFCPPALPHDRDRSNHGPMGDFTIFRLRGLYRGQSGCIFMR